MRTFTTQVRTRTLAAPSHREGKAESAGAPREPLVNAPPRPGRRSSTTPRIARSAGALKAGSAKNVVEMPAKMTSRTLPNTASPRADSPAAHWRRQSRDARRRTSNWSPVPAPHSPQWAPEYEPTIKGASARRLRRSWAASMRVP